MDIVEEFINRRFKDDCDWISGNCYYFAIILKDRFKQGIIYYDVIWGHFLIKINDAFYDWTGKRNFSLDEISYFIEWDKFDDYDCLQKKIIMRDCIE